MSQYFPKPYEPFGEDINIEATGIDTSNLALKSNLANLAAEIDKIDVDKLKTVPTDLSKLSNVVDNKVYDKKLFMIN